MRALLVFTFIILIGVPSSLWATNTSTPTRTITPTPQPTSTAPDVQISRIYRSSPVYKNNVAKVRPTPGDSITVTIELKNGGGSNTVQSRLDCTVNGVARTPSPVPTIVPGGATTQTLTENFTIPMTVSCRVVITTPQANISSDNDSLDVRLDGSPLTEYVEQTVYDFFKYGQQQYCQGGCYGRTYRTTMEDWLQSEIKFWNARLEANGIDHPIYLQRLAVYPDGALGDGTFKSDSLEWSTLYSCDPGSNWLGHCTTPTPASSECGGAACVSCATQISGNEQSLPNKCDRWSEVIWSHRLSDAQTQLWGPHGNYSTTFNLDFGEMHEWGHAAGAEHSQIYATVDTKVTIHDPPSTPVAGSSILPVVGRCSGGTNDGAWCFVGISGDCPSGSCSGINGLLTFPPLPDDYMTNTTSSMYASETTRLNLNWTKANRCTWDFGATNSATLNFCNGRDQRQRVPVDAKAVIIDGGGSIVTGTSTLNVWQPEFGGGSFLLPDYNFFTTEAPFATISAPSGIAKLGAYPFTTNIIDFGSSKCNMKEATNTYCAVFNSEDGFGGYLGYYDANQDGTINARDSAGWYPINIGGTAVDCINCILMTKVTTPSSAKSYGFLNQTWWYGAVGNGHNYPLVPMWVPLINHVTLTKPDIAILGSNYEDQCDPSSGGRSYSVHAYVFNAGQSMISHWTHQWKVNGNVITKTVDHRALYIGEPEYQDTIFTNAKMGDTVCFEADLEGAIDEQNESNNETCITLPAS